MSIRKPPHTPPSHLIARPPGHASAYYEEEEIDEIESFARDAEHDEEERDPDPVRYLALSEHAQDQRACRERPISHKNHPKEHPGR